MLFTRCPVVGYQLCSGKQRRRGILKTITKNVWWAEGERGICGMCGGEGDPVTVPDQCSTFISIPISLPCWDYYAVSIQEIRMRFRDQE